MKLSRIFAPTVLAVLLLWISAPAAAGGFCPSYGMGCYRTPKADPSFFLLEIASKPGDYMGSIRLVDGQCGLFGCGPCDKAKRGLDYDAMCNERFIECEGRCEAR